MTYDEGPIASLSAHQNPDCSGDMQSRLSNACPGRALPDPAVRMKTFGATGVVLELWTFLCPVSIII